MIHTKFLPGQDQNELMDYTLYLHRCGYTRIQFKPDSTAGRGSGFFVRFDDGTAQESPRSAVVTDDQQAERMVEGVE